MVEAMVILPLDRDNRSERMDPATRRALMALAGRELNYSLIGNAVGGNYTVNGVAI